MLDVRGLQSLVAFATTPGRSSFYRDLYLMSTHDAARSITSLEEWKRLPFTTKHDLEKMPMGKRLFAPFAALDHIRVSSGTSGKPPLFSPRVSISDLNYRREFHDFKRGILTFTVPVYPHWHEDMQASIGIAPRVVAYDPAAPSASVRLAHAQQVDSICVFTHHIRDIGECMKHIAMNQHIRFIEITGEACTHSLFSYIRTTFPNALVLPQYGSSEVEDAPLGVPCRPITGVEPLSLYHPRSTHYLEILGNDEILVEPRGGLEGELVVSTWGATRSFPLIRYRTGDMIRVVDEQCPRHGIWSFTVLGRVELDFVKMPGGILRADEIERVLRALPDDISDQFELHCFTESTDTGPLIRPVLYVETNESTDLNKLARDISDMLRVAPLYSYTSGVKAGRYVPITCERFTAPKGKKTRRIIKHSI